jgi:hypothetical protein
MDKLNNLRIFVLKYLIHKTYRYITRIIIVNIITTLKSIYIYIYMYIYINI